MYRRQFNSLLIIVGAGMLAPRAAHALSLADLTSSEASQGIKAALEKGAVAAVSQLGQKGGFTNNDKVRIPLPGFLEDAARLLRRLGQGQRVDELVNAMNQAAEQAVPLAKDLLVGAVKSMSLADAKKILMGGDTSATAYFSEKTRAPLSIKFLPVVAKTTEKVGLAQKYNQLTEKAAGLGLIKKDSVSIEQYVTGKALDGLYTLIGDEEKKIRQDPLGTGSAILKKVFGAVG